MRFVQNKRDMCLQFIGQKCVTYMLEYMQGIYLVQKGPVSGEMFRFVHYIIMELAPHSL